MSPAIRVKDLSKCYRIGGLNAGYATFREMFAVALVTPFRRLRGHRRAPGETVWALKDVDFDVQPGEVVGLIGHNGAGKSTLLKILSRITVPTKGRTEVYGKMGSLLEIGTGFHPDLTGRENIYLSGAILGISRAEVARKFDEVVEFSGIEQFIDTPVKWYSSGMYLRLAFAVAAHLETEVLVMDEVLAVGDVSFQQKCLDKMHEIRSQGRTILFVSHSMPAVTRLCQRVILLEKGQMVNDGPAHEVVNSYLGANWQLKATREWDDAQAPGNEVVRMRRARVRNHAGETTESADIRHQIGIELSYEVLQPGHVLAPKVDLYNEGGVHLFASHDVTPDWLQQPRPKGHYVSTVWIPGNFLSEGNMIVYASIVSHTPATALHANAPHAVTFQVVDSQSSDSARGNYVGAIAGAVRPLLNWTTDFAEGKGA